MKTISEVRNDIGNLIEVARSLLEDAEDPSDRHEIEKFIHDISKIATQIDSHELSQTDTIYLDIVENIEKLSQDFKVYLVRQPDFKPPKKYAKTIANFSRKLGTKL